MGKTVGKMVAELLVVSVCGSLCGALVAMGGGLAAVLPALLFAGVAALIGWHIGREDRRETLQAAYIRGYKAARRHRRQMEKDVSDMFREPGPVVDGEFTEVI